MVLGKEKYRGKRSRVEGFQFLKLNPPQTKQNKKFGQSVEVERESGR